MRWMLAAAVLGNGPSVMAQDQAHTTSVAKMFLLPSDTVGVMITWLLVLLSALSIGYTLSLVLRYRRSVVLPEAVRDQVVQLLAAKRYREAIDYAARQTSYLGRVISAALNEGVHGYAAMERAIEEAGDAQTSRALRPVEYLNVLGNIAPMIGLFGTVYGMIRAFDQLQASGGKPDPAQLAGGISTAMITTFWGLIVAIPALASYALIRNKIDALTSEGMLMAEEVIAPLKPGNQPGQANAKKPTASPEQSNTTGTTPPDSASGESQSQS
ncbi:MAG: MotA/TolQ/ExbB proton channel family protein [Phycisphaeraceae bacterium]